jgi:hypothetical protein
MAFFFCTSRNRWDIEKPKVNLPVIELGNERKSEYVIAFGSSSDRGRTYFKFRKHTLVAVLFDMLE